MSNRHALVNTPMQKNRRLGPGQLAIISAMTNGAATVTEIARAAGVGDSAVYNNLRALLRRGLVICAMLDYGKKPAIWKLRE
jgi:DNA-binding IclR family transcriptional regulator